MLTEERRFGGSLEDLRSVRAAVETPILRKDFIVEGYQLLEARAAGADLALLIVAALGDDDLRRLHDQARELGLTVLVEVHDEPETERAVALGAELVGINARNLKTLQVDTATFAKLAPTRPRRSGARRRVRHLRTRGRGPLTPPKAPARCWSARLSSRTATPRPRSERCARRAVDGIADQPLGRRRAGLVRRPRKAFGADASCPRRWWPPSTS